MNVEKATPDDFVTLINDKFREHCGKISRIDIKWGKWSVVMNKEIRRRLDEKPSPKNAPQLAMVYNYWIVMSQLLELKFRYKGKFFGKNKIKQKIREAQRLMEAMEL
jgi:hypothetical protein